MGKLITALVLMGSVSMFSASANAAELKKAAKAVVSTAVEKKLKKTTTTTTTPAGNGESTTSTDGSETTANAPTFMLPLDAPKQ